MAEDYEYCGPEVGGVGHRAIDISGQKIDRRGPTVCAGVVLSPLVAAPLRHVDPPRETGHCKVLAPPHASFGFGPRRDTGRRMELLRAPRERRAGVVGTVRRADAVVEVPAPSILTHRGRVIRFRLAPGR